MPDLATTTGARLRHPTVLELPEVMNIEVKCLINQGGYLRAEKRRLAADFGEMT